MNRSESSFGRLLARAFAGVLGKARGGSVAFVRCLSPEAVERLARDPSFQPDGWRVHRIADEEDGEARTIPADQAVEAREGKGGALLFLVDTELAGAGMDGIFSAGREVREQELFRTAHKVALAAITARHDAGIRRYALAAIRPTRAGAFSISPASRFEFLCRVLDGDGLPGAHLALLGLWPVLDSLTPDFQEALSRAEEFAAQLLGAAGSGLPPGERVEALQLDPDLDEERKELLRYLTEVDILPARDALDRLEGRRDLWIGRLRIKAPTKIHGVELIPWRNRNGSLAKWSGLTPGPAPEDPPELVLPRDRGQDDAGFALEVRWMVDPPRLPKGAAEYRISVWSDQDEPLLKKRVRHRALRSGEKLRFTREEFDELPEDAVLSAAVRLEVAGSRPEIKSRDSEEFQIRFGEKPEPSAAGAGQEMRAFSEGLIDLGDRPAASAAAANRDAMRWDPRQEWVVLRTPFIGGRRRSYKVRRPALIAKVENDWVAREGAIGSWTLEVRADGAAAGQPTFEPLNPVKGSAWEQAWEQAGKASRRLARRFGEVGGAAQIYDAPKGMVPVVRDYLKAWSRLLTTGSPAAALANTLVVRSQSGHTIGLVVLPAHPVRVAWHSAYDNLVFQAAFAQEQKPSDVRRELGKLDGAMFPAFLPNPQGGAFVFADMLGFHLPAMVADGDPEPKAAVALLARALAAKPGTGAAPSVGGRTAQVLAKEVRRYLDAHGLPRVLHLHALRAGDAMTVARALGSVLKKPPEEDADSNAVDRGSGERDVRFALDLYPSDQQRSVAGRFISEAREKRRTATGVLPEKDRWMLESLSLPGGVTRPRLRWARKKHSQPRASAHLAVAFDTFESRVEAAAESAEGETPHYAYGLSSFYERQYAAVPSPTWSSRPTVGGRGRKHPAGPSHTDALTAVQRALRQSLVRRLGSAGKIPILRTCIGSEEAESLDRLHHLADWVVTLDRNAGIEYFDSPRDNAEIYDAYVIDCVPEREDLGCLQLITSTRKLDEVRSVLDPALGAMGLPQSRKDAYFVLEQLKALSGRLAIRLTGRRPPTAELVALAATHASCRSAARGDVGWVSLEDGFLAPVDDIPDLFAPFAAGARPDLIYVALKRRLCLRFIEVKYRRNLRGAQAADTRDRIVRQTREFRKAWDRYYGRSVAGVFRAVRRAHLARVLRFYADKAARHHLSTERHRALVREIDSMLAKGAAYEFAHPPDGDLGWVFCPEYRARRPLRIWPGTGHVEVFLCGPAAMLDPRDPAGNNPGPEDVAPHPGAGAAGRSRGKSPLGGVDAPRGAGATSPTPSDDAADPTTPPESNADARTPPRLSLGRDTRSGVRTRLELSVQGNPHLLVAGLPGMGKTTCLVNVCRQMVAQDVLPIVFSYHQDIDEKLKAVAGPLRFVDFAGLGFNPLEIVSRRGRVNAHLDVAGSIRDIFTAIYPEIGDVQSNRIRTAVKESFEEVGWGPGQAGEQTPPFGRFMEILRGVPDRDIGLRRLLDRLGELEDYGLFAPAPAGEDRSLWSGDRPTVVRVHSTQNEVLQRAFSFLVFYGMYKDMFRRGIQDGITHALLFDEAHRAAKLKLLPTMAKECRKYGVAFLLASQEARDFDPSVFSAIANYLILRCTDVDARTLVRNVATRGQERSLVDQIKQMPKFKALHFSEGRSHPSRVALDPPAPVAPPS